MSYLTTIWLFVIFVFIAGVSVGVYNGTEMSYPGINTTGNLTGNYSVITTSILKMADGAMMLFFESGNLFGKYCIDNNIDLNRILKMGIWLFYSMIILATVYFILKLFVYIYIITKEIKLTRKENDWLKNATN